MVNFNVSVTQGIVIQPSDIGSGVSTTYTISNPQSVPSYFTLETLQSSNGGYTASSPKNTVGTFSLGTGLSGLIQSEYITSVIVAPGGGILTFVPTNNITAATLLLRGVGA
jgi:hypothetical protein